MVAEKAIEPLNDSWPDPPIDAATYTAILNALNTAHRTVTDQGPKLPIRLIPVLDAIDDAITATQEARRGN